MLEHTRKRHINSDSLAYKREEGKSIPWRESAKELIEKYSEAGLTLRGNRYKNDMTQKQLAERLGISQHHISEMENGKRPIGKAMAKRLAEVFETDYRIFL